MNDKNYVIDNLEKKRLWNKRMMKIFIAIFLFLFVLGLCSFLRPKHSNVEKRDLSKRPAVTVQGILDGSFFSEYASWYADTYPLREPMIAANHALTRLYGIHSKGTLYSGGGGQGQADAIPTASSSAETAPAESVGNNSGASASSAASTSSAASGSGAENGTINQVPEVAGTIYITDHQGFELYYFSQENADAYASMINTVSQRLGSSVNLYDMVIPTSFGVCLSKDVQESLGASYQGDAIPYIYSRISKDVHTLSVFDTLVKHNSEYEYFRTDHHWTALGAYYAYRVFCENKEIMPETQESFQTMDFPGFLGTYYAYSNQSAELAEDPDTVTAYVPHDTNELTYVDVDGNTIQANVINDATDYSEENKYLTFIAGDQPYEEIHNPKQTNGESCVVVKESFGNAFVPFLVDHYQTIYVIDYRYYQGDLTKFCRDQQIKDVLFLNNTEAVTEDRAAEMLSLFPES